jgi:small subunit ribosomal protein S16
MLKIRLQRIGRRRDPQFRVIVTDARRGPKSGNFIEILGSYNAKTGLVQLKKERIEYWLSVGTQMSDTVYNFMVTHKIVEGRKRNALPKKRAPKPEPKVEETPAPVVATPAVEETPAPVSTPETPAEIPVEVIAEEIAIPAETPAEVVAEAPLEEAPAETATETSSEETPAE